MSRRGGGAHDSSFRSSSSSTGRDYGNSGGSGGGNRYESRNSGHVGRRNSPVHHNNSNNSHHHHNNNHGGSRWPSPGSSPGYRPRDSSAGSGGRVRRDSDSRMLPPPPPRISTRGRGRALPPLSLRGRPLGSTRSFRGRIGRVDSSRPMRATGRRILPTNGIRSRELLRLKTSKMRR